jgi:hypothetical protein
MGKFSAPGNRAAGAYQRQKKAGSAALRARFFATFGRRQTGGHTMSIAFDHILLARILFTLMTAGYAFATVLADFNQTHATNPKWTPHARFHVVWQICSYVGFGVLALALIWWPGPLALERLYLVAAMGAIVYAAFFVALIAMPIYGGRAYDDNGYRPFKAPIPIISKTWDANITVFCIQVTILLAGVAAVTA